MAEAGKQPYPKELGNSCPFPTTDKHLFLVYQKDRAYKLQKLK